MTMARVLTLLALAALLVVEVAAVGSSPSTPNPSPNPGPENCVMTAWTCGACSKECAGGIQKCTRSEQTPAKNGGSCADPTNKEQACNTGACASPPPPPPSPPPIIATVNMTVAATLTLAADVMGSDSEAAFKAKILPTIAKAAGVETSAVALSRVVTTTRRRGLLAAAVQVHVNVTYGVDGTAAARQLATDNAVPFMTKARYMTSWLLPASMANAAHSGVTALDAPAAVGLVCPPDRTYADALNLTETKRYAEAKRVLNDLAICAHESGTGLDAASMADNYNLLGFANRKLDAPDVGLSELFYKRALQINPRHVAANGYLGELYVETNKTAEAREVLDNLKTMCPPPAGCESLDYLRAAMAAANLVEGAFVRRIQWGECFELKCSPTNVTKGDSIDFRYPSTHDVANVSSSEYAACSNLQANVVGSPSDGVQGYVHAFDTAGTFYFACGQGAHCEGGQKMVVNVFEPRAVAPSGDGANIYSRAKPPPPSTMDDSGAVAFSSPLVVAAAVNALLAASALL